MRAGYPPILLLFFVITWGWCWTTKIGTCKDTAGTCRCWFQAFVIYAQLWSWTTNQPTGLEHMFAEYIQKILRLLFSLSTACKSSVKTSPAAAFRKMCQLCPTSRKTMVPGVFPHDLRSSHLTSIWMNYTDLTSWRRMNNSKANPQMVSFQLFAGWVIVIQPDMSKICGKIAMWVVSIPMFPSWIPVGWKSMRLNL